MKVFLALSLTLNLVLGYFLLSQEERSSAPPLEKLIIESHHETLREGPAANLEVKKEKTPEIKPPEENKEEVFAEIPPFHEDEFSMALEKMEQERAQFIFDDLNLPPEFLSQYQQLRQRHEESVAMMWTSGGEPSFEAREKMLKLEKRYHDDLVKLFGRENWSRYKKFLDNYNRRSQKQGEYDQRPYIYMQP